MSDNGQIHPSPWMRRSRGAQQQAARQPKCQGGWQPLRQALQSPALGLAFRIILGLSHPPSAMLGSPQGAALGELQPQTG